MTNIEIQEVVVATVEVTEADTGNVQIFDITSQLVNIESCGRIEI